MHHHDSNHTHCKAGPNAGISGVLQPEQAPAGLATVVHTPANPVRGLFDGSLPVAAPETHEVPLGSGHVLLLDAGDWERECTCEFRGGLLWRGRVCDRPWYAHVKDHTVYVVSTLPGGLQLRLHRALCNATLGQIVDHRDHNGLNNRRSNLRVTDCTGNSRNRLRAHGRELPKGVAFHRESGRFEAYIRHEGHKRHLGLFDDPKVAAEAYDREAKKLFGEFALLNFA